MRKIKTAIIGTGNIGSDLLVKIQRSKYLECSIFTGRNLESPGSQFAMDRGVTVSDKSIDALIENPDCYEIVFDSTSAASHLKHAPILKSLNKFTLDLTPAKVGIMCIPVINMEDALHEKNVNLVTCGGQATIPIAYAIAQVHPEATYIETVSTIASKSAGIGTRNNVDEFTQTTKDAVGFFTKVKHTKSLIVMNPAEPPINMRSTVYALIPEPNMELISKNVKKIAEKARKYVPGYELILGPLYENGRVTTTIEVTGLGDYLPSYAGNLDITTCAALNVAEEYAKKLINEGK